MPKTGQFRGAEALGQPKTSAKPSSSALWKADSESKPVIAAMKSLRHPKSNRPWIC
jgi:hypothetical protein